VGLHRRYKVFAQHARRDHQLGLLVGAGLTLLAVAAALFWMVPGTTSLLGGNDPANEGTSVPTAAPDITGEITEMYYGTASARQPDAGDPDKPVSSGDASDQAPRGNALVALLVEEDPAAQTGSAKAQVNIRGQTRILKQEAGAITEGSAKDLRQGLQVRAWFDGPVAESYPVQATGALILILGPK
jgi:hypothetical protein